MAAKAEKITDAVDCELDPVLIGNMPAIQECDSDRGHSQNIDHNYNVIRFRPIKPRQVIQELAEKEALVFTTGKNIGTVNEAAFARFVGVSAHTINRIIAGEAETIISHHMAELFTEKFDVNLLQARGWVPITYSLWHERFEDLTAIESEKVSDYIDILLNARK